MLSIVIVSFNTRDLLDQCLRSIRRHCAEAEVVVVDNGSRDDSVATVQRDHPWVTLLETGENLGFAGATNRGIQETTGDFVLLLNSDTVLEDDSLTRCVQWMQENPELGAVSPQLVGVDDRPQRAYHAFPTLGARARRALSHNKSARVPDPNETGWLAGTALLMRREALDAIGGQLDDNYWMYWEDADTCAKLIAAGWRVAEYEEAQIRHYGGASGGGPDATRRGDLYAHYAWGEHRWFFRHRPWPEALLVWLLDFLDVFRKALRGLVRRHRRTDLGHAVILARVLAYRAIGRQPPIPT